MACDDDLLPVKIFNIYPYAETQQGGMGGQSFLVFLKGEASRVVPITIGQFEGQALVMALRRIPLPRPLPHNLLQELLEKMNAKVHRLVIHTLRGDVFHAHLLIQTEDEIFKLDCRPSDGMILASLLGAPVFMTLEVMEEAGRDLQLEPVCGSGADARQRPGSTRVECAESADEYAIESAEQPAEVTLTEVERLNVRLTRLIAEEAYEEAARVRDQIRELDSE